LFAILLDIAVSTAEAMEHQMARKVIAHFTLIFQHLHENTKDSN
jgi:hypothetical protein